MLYVARLTRAGLDVTRPASLFFSEWPPAPTLLFGLIARDLLLGCRGGVGWFRYPLVAWCAPFARGNVFLRVTPGTGRCVGTIISRAFSFPGRLRGSSFAGCS